MKKVQKYLNFRAKNVKNYSDGCNAEFWRENSNNFDLVNYLNFRAKMAKIIELAIMIDFGGKIQITSN